jgi:hypothetical protein
MAARFAASAEPSQTPSAQDPGGPARTANAASGASSPVDGVTRRASGSQIFCPVTGIDDRLADLAAERPELRRDSLPSASTRWP